MGLGGISIWQLLILLLIIVLVFGTKKLRNIGVDLGNAFKGFKASMQEGEESAAATEKNQSAAANSSPNDPGRVIEGQVTTRDKTS